MKRRAAGICLSLVLLVLAVCAAQADFDYAGVMVSPAFLELVPQSSLIRRCTVYSGNYTFSCAPLYYKPEEREEQIACGPGLTDPATESASPRLKLPGVSIFEMKWMNGWNPERITVSAWDLALFDNPERKDELFLESFTVENDRVVLKPDRVYQITGEWIQDSPDDESGQAEYYLITAQMTGDEIAEAREREAGAFTEEDLHYMTLKLNGVDYTLGRSTPQDLIDNGWHLSDDMDVLTFRDVEGWSDVYVTTENNDLREPILYISAMWAYETAVEYCGFSWNTETEDDSYDDNRENEASYDDDREDEDVPDGEEEPSYDMVSWMKENFPMDTSVEGIYTIVIPLSNGREVEVGNHDSPPSLRLLPEHAFTPVTFREVNRENGSYDLKITDRDRIDSDGFFTALIYQPDLYPGAGLGVLRVGDRIQINGRRGVISSIEAWEEDRWEIGIDDPDHKGYTDYFVFRKKDAESGLYYATSMGDWVPTTYLDCFRVNLPLPENFTYVEISAGEEIVRPTEELIELLRSGNMDGWNPYNTSIDFADDVPVQILHSGYPAGPDN